MSTYGGNLTFFLIENYLLMKLLKISLKKCKKMSEKYIECFIILLFMRKILDRNYAEHKEN